MAKIKVGLIYQTTKKPWGGVNTFFRNFEEYLKSSEELSLASSLINSDIILSAGHYKGPGSLLKQRNFRNIACGRNLESLLGVIPIVGSKKIVFRVDGLRSIYANMNSKADELLIRNMKFASSIVFQSKFSQNCFDDLNISYPPMTSIIHNGACSRIFYPNKHPKPLSGRLRLVSSSWSTNPLKGFKIIADFSELKNVDVTHIGRWPVHLPVKNVNLLGEMTEEKIANVLRQNHFLLFPSQNEACSNTVVEALACGLPVIYHPSGGTPELFQDGCFGLPLPDDIFSNSSQNLFVEKLRAQYADFQLEVIEHIDNFVFEACLKRYADFFIKVLES